MRREVPLPVAVAIVVVVLLLVVGAYWYFSRPRGGTAENIPEMGTHPSGSLKPSSPAPQPPTR